MSAPIHPVRPTRGASVAFLVVGVISAYDFVE